MNINIRNTDEYGDVEEKIMIVLKEHNLNYVEALGVIETLKLQIGESFLNEEL